MIPLSKTKKMARSTARQKSDLAHTILDNSMRRRELIKLLALHGVSLTSLAPLLSRASTENTSANFDWKKHQGDWVNVLLVEHPYSTALIDNVDDFKYLTGMNVRFEVLPGKEYFFRLDRALEKKSSEIDVAMTGAYSTWIYGPQNKYLDLNPWINDPEKTNPDYDWDDFIASVRKSCAWSGVLGSPLGSKQAHQWCIPLGYEQNCISYNKKIMTSLNIATPTNIDELIEFSAQIKQSKGGVTGIGLRGSSDWSTIHAGFLSAYTNFGESDLRVNASGKLEAAVNTQGSRYFHQKWVELIKSGSSKGWSTSTWYEVSDSLKNRQCAMIYDADILGYEANSPQHSAGGQIGYIPFKANPEAPSPTSNIWITGLAIPQFSDNKDGGWFFCQWATGKSHGLYSAISRDAANPVRKSVWENFRFRYRLDTRYKGYLESHEAQVDGSSIKFTPHPLFFDITNEWARSLQAMVLSNVPVAESLEKLEISINNKLNNF